MKIYRLFLIISMMLLNFPSNFIQASQDTQGSENDALVNHAEIYPDLVEGFDVLRQHGFGIPTFQEFIQLNGASSSSQDEKTLSLLILQAQQLIFDCMHDHFLTILNWAMDQNIQDPAQIEDQIFQYVIKYKDVFMKPALKIWVNLKNLHGDALRKTLTPLQWAAHVNSAGFVQFLIAVGADVHAKDLMGKTALFFACVHNSIIVPLILLHAGAKVNIENSAYSPLHIAVSANAGEVVALLISRGAHINARGFSGKTSLYVAVEKDFEGIVQILLRAGAQMEIADNNGWTPLHVAADNHLETVAQLLIMHHANINALNNQGETPLHLAVKSGAIGIVSLLVEARANLNLQENLHGYTALHYAALLNLFNIVQILLDAGANMMIVDHHGHVASELSQDDQMLVLFEEVFHQRILQLVDSSTSGSDAALAG